MLSTYEWEVEAEVEVDQHSDLDPLTTKALSVTSTLVHSWTVTQLNYSLMHVASKE